MALFIKTKNGLTASKLLDHIRKMIDNAELQTWEYVGDNFYHITKSDQWNEGGFLHYENQLTSNNELVLYYKIEEGTKPRNGTYGILHGRFVELLLNHFLDKVEIGVRKIS